MLNIGIIGVGGIGGVHLAAWRQIADVNVAALCDRIPARAEGREAVLLNIGGGEMEASTSTAYTDIKDILADQSIDAVDICLPTDLHAEVTIAALQAGKHVLCEKPMARTSAECEQMIAAADAAGRTLMIAHCIRFWPEYALLKDIVAGGCYGNVRHAAFRRLSPLPTWSVDNWLLDPARSGGAGLDLHIHDVDYVRYLLGEPEQVEAHPVTDQHGVSHISTTYRFAGGAIAQAEGGWGFPPAYPFRMTFLVRLEHAAIEWDTARAPMTIYPDDGESFTPDVPAGDGYYHELVYFRDCLLNGTRPTIVTPQDACNSVRLVETELR